jgi:hypothetical protein
MLPLYNSITSTNAFRTTRVLSSKHEGKRVVTESVDASGKSFVLKRSIVDSDSTGVRESRVLGAIEPHHNVVTLHRATDKLHDDERTSRRYRVVTLLFECFPGTLKW